MESYDRIIKMNRLVPRVVTGLSVVIILAFAFSLTMSG